MDESINESITEQFARNEVLPRVLMDTCIMTKISVSEVDILRRYDIYSNIVTRLEV
jgi:hypothetical protein